MTINLLSDHQFIQQIETIRNIHNNDSNHYYLNYQIID
jgi:hypothetical protein